jgi:hypothetical protein
VRSAIKRWIASSAMTSVKTSTNESNGLLMGGIELITPSMINGWVWHPHLRLYDVRLLSKGSLLAAAKIEIHRKDVEEKVGVNGDHAFSLRLPVQTPAIDFSQELQLVALTADGSERFSLSCMKDKSSTQALLKTALDPRYLGMEGNFDGLGSSGTLLSGWCFQSLRPTEHCTVYLQVAGMAAVPVRCDQPRPSFAALGYPDSCGFVFRLADLAHIGSLAGKRLTVTFDESGLLPLPESSPLVLPALDSSPQLYSSIYPQGNIGHDQQSDSTLQVHAPSVYSSSPEFARYWNELEDFKKLCDVFEREIAARIRQEALSKNRRIGGWKGLFKRSA